jgi:protein-tyrosine-phosphatase
MHARPTSVLFCCDDNAIRSPLAEGLAKQAYGTAIYVQSAGVRAAAALAPLAAAVAEELGIDLSAHRVRSFRQMEAWGDQIATYDLVVALSPAAQRHALEYTRWHAIDVVYWPIFDPSGLGEAREERLAAYRQTRDQIAGRIRDRFGPPAAGRPSVAPR